MDYDSSKSHISQDDHRVIAMVDAVHWTRKPTKHQVSQITTRLQESGYREIDVVDLALHIAQGGAWMGGCFQPRTWPFVTNSKNNFGDFAGQQLFGIDVDDGTDPLTVLDKAFASGLTPLFWYPTFSATVDPWNPRHRVVFDAGEVLDDGDARSFDLMLKSIFTMCDPQCFNRRHTRVFQGTCYQVQFCNIADAERYCQAVM